MPVFGMALPGIPVMPYPIESEGSLRYPMLMFVKPSSGVLGLVMVAGLAAGSTALLATPARALGPVNGATAPSIRGDARSILGQFAVLTVVPINPEQAFVEGYEAYRAHDPMKTIERMTLAADKYPALPTTRSSISDGPARERRRAERRRDVPAAELRLSAKRVRRRGVAPVRGDPIQAGAARRCAIRGRAAGRTQSRSRHRRKRG